MVSRNVVRKFCGYANIRSEILRMGYLSWPKVKPHSTVASNEKTQPDEKSREEQAKSSNEVGKDETVDNSLEQENKKLVEENKKLIEQIKEIDDKYKRALAENENVRQRMKRQIDEAKQYGIQGFCKDLLDVADVLSKATESVPKDALSKDNIHLVNLYQGLQMTEAQFQSVFRRHSLTQINPLGEKFDPNQHEAMFEQVVPGKEPGTVCIVTKIGYKLHGRTIRPATVGVVKAA